MKETEDPIITPFVRWHIENGFEIKRTRIGSDLLKTCRTCQNCIAVVSSSYNIYKDEKRNI